MQGDVEGAVRERERGSLRRRELVKNSKVICEANKEHILRFDTVNTNNGLSPGTSIAYLHVLIKLGEYIPLLVHS